jgi:hypothetical protein
MSIVDRVWDLDAIIEILIIKSVSVLEEIIISIIKQTGLTKKLAAPFNVQCKTVKQYLLNSLFRGKDIHLAVVALDKL